MHWVISPEEKCFDGRHIGSGVDNLSLKMLDIKGVDRYVV